MTDNTDTDGPGTDGPGTDGPDTDGPDTDGPGTDGPGTDGPDTDGPDTDGPDTVLAETAGLPLTELPATELPQHSFFTRLYTGTGAFEVVGRRKLWFGISFLIVGIAIASIVLRGFTFGIDFEGGTKMSFPRDGASGEASIVQVEETFSQTIGRAAQSVVVVGNGATATVQIRSEALDNDQTAKLREALFEKFQPKGVDGQPSKQAISDSAVSETWGGQITNKALIALAVFLVLVAIYITLRYERYMALAALAALGFDLITTAGVYALVGFEVTPATVIVFDKVEENTKGFEHTTRRTFAEQANLAINQTFMRSINTSLISVMPVLSLIVVAVWVLGVGTLKDLALVQLVGILVGTYSSIFFATPLLVTMRERTELVRSHTRRVLARRERLAAPNGVPGGSGELTTAVVGEAAALAVGGSAVGTKPAPGARPIRPRRPSGKRER